MERVVLLALMRLEDSPRRLVAAIVVDDERGIVPASRAVFEARLESVSADADAILQGMVDGYNSRLRRVDSGKGFLNGDKVHWREFNRCFASAVSQFVEERGGYPQVLRMPRQYWDLFVSEADGLVKRPDGEGGNCWWFRGLRVSLVESKTFSVGTAGDGEYWVDL